MNSKSVDILPPEIWIKIFQNLTPIDLCFSVSPVNHLFYKLSQDNQLWSAFKSDAWDENTTFSLVPTKTPTFLKNSGNKENLFKSLYINWIREQGKHANNLNGVPAWPKTEGKREFKLAVSGNIILKDSGEFDNILLENHGASITKTATEYGKISFPGELFSNKDIYLYNYSMVMSRMPISYNIDLIVKDMKGIFWCIDTFNDFQKEQIELIKKGLDLNSPFDSYLMVVDFSSFCREKQICELDKKTKNWLETLGVEFIEGKNIGDALNNMIKILDAKYNRTYPKYLPTTTEFEKYVYKPKLQPVDTNNGTRKNVPFIENPVPPKKSNPILNYFKKIFSKN